MGTVTLSTVLYVVAAAAFAIVVIWAIAILYRIVRQDPLIARYSDERAVSVAELVVFGIFTAMALAGVAVVLFVL